MKVERAFGMPSAGTEQHFTQNADDQSDRVRIDRAYIAREAREAFIDFFMPLSGLYRAAVGQSSAKTKEPSGR